MDAQGNLKAQKVLVYVLKALICNVFKNVGLFPHANRKDVIEGMSKEKIASLGGVRKHLQETQ
eukprot:2712605-Rhodomonas_salina.8